MSQPVTPTAPIYDDSLTSTSKGEMFSTSSYFTIHQKAIKGLTGQTYQQWSKHIGQGTGAIITPTSTTILSSQWKGGMTWMELKTSLKNMFLSTSRDAGLIKRIQNLIMKMVPVRTGRLLDVILNTMKIVRKSWYSSHFWAILSFIWDADRPYPITGIVANSPPEKGYGDTYTPTNPIPNVHRLYYTKGGNARYMLNDPAASADPISDIRFTAKYIIEEDFREIFDDLTIVLHTKKRHTNPQPPSTTGTTVTILRPQG